MDDALMAVARGKGWHGCSNAGEARVALALSRAGMAPGETAQQFRIGRWRLDFAWPEVGVAMEADGWVHTAASVRRRDRERDRELASWRWRVVRVDVDEPDLDARVATVVAVVRRAQRRCCDGWGCPNHRDPAS